MGYTHYFRQQRSFTDLEWNLLKEKVNQILQAIQEGGIELESNADTALVTDTYINFNGVDELSHETFEIRKVKNSDFDFCKTAHKPYDLAVTSALLAIYHYFPESFEISSDGSASEWTRAVTFNKKVLNIDCSLPDRIREENSY